LPQKLENGRDLLYFSSVDDLIEKCHELLANKELQEHLSEGARQYYEREVKPRKRVLRLLEQAFESETGSHLSPDTSLGRI
jgi:hypothetical protein